MDIAGEPRSPTLDFKGLDDTTTYELFDEGSVSQTRKRRRSSLRRVSFAERPSIHVFARDDDYETPPEGTTSHFSGQSSPGTSMSTSPQRRSGRLIAAARGRENEMEKENTVPNLSVGSNANDGRRKRRPLAVRGNDKVKESEEFLKPSAWLDEPEPSAFGSCDENTGPVDLRHISFGEQRTTVEDDDNVTMDSQTFKTRMSLVLARQPLQPLSEEKFVHVATPTDTNTDMELTAFETERKLQGKHRPPTWHRGDNSPSDMSLSLGPLQWKFSHIGSSQERKHVGGDDDDNRSSGLLEDSQLQSRRSDIQMNNLPALPANDDTVSMDTTSMDTTLDSQDGNNPTEEGDKMPSSGTMRFADPKDYDDTVSMDITGQSLASQGLENTVTFDKNSKDCEEEDRSLVNEDYSESLEQDGRNVLESSAVNVESENSLLQGQRMGLESQDAYQAHDNTINFKNNSKVFKEHVHLAPDDDSYGALQQNKNVTEVSATNCEGERSLSQGRRTLLKSSDSFQAHDDTVPLKNNSDMFKAHIHSAADDDYSGTSKQNGKVTEVLATNPENDKVLSQGRGGLLERLDSLPAHDETVTFKKTSKVFKDNLHSTADDGAFGALKQNGMFTEVNALKPEGEGRSMLLERPDSLQAHDETVTFKNISRVLKNNLHSTVDDGAFGALKQNGKFTEMSALNPEGESSLSQGRSMLLERPDSLQAHDDTVTFKNISRVLKNNLHSTVDDGAFGALKQNGKFTEMSALNPEGESSLSEGRSILLARLDSLQAHDETVTLKNSSKVFKENLHSTVDDGSFGALKQNEKFAEVSASNPEGESSLSQGRSILRLRLDSMQAQDDTVAFKANSKLVKGNLRSAAEDDDSGTSKQNGKISEVSAPTSESETSLTQGRSILLKTLNTLQAHHENGPLKTLSQERDSQFDSGRGAQGFTSGATDSYVGSRGPLGSIGHTGTVSLEATSQSQPNKFHSEGQMGNLYPGNDETVSMDITRALTGRIQQIASVQRMSTDSAKPFVWLNNVQDMDMSDADLTDKFQDRVTAAIPHLKDLLDAYPETPSAPGHNARLAPLPTFTNQNSQRGLGIDTGPFEGPNLRRGNILLRGADPHEASDISTMALATNLERKEPFRDSEDSFSFKVPQHSSQKKRESLEGSSEERAFASQQVGAFRPVLSDVQDTVHSMESNLWNNSSAPLQKLGPNLQDRDHTRELTDQEDWLGDASSDMSTTPLSPSRPNFMQGLTNNPQGSAMQTGSDFMDSPSLQDGITASIPKVKDLLAADEGASESESAWNPRRISWSTQHQSHQTVGDIPASMCQPRIDPTEDETIHSMPDNLRTPGAQNKEDAFLSMTKEGANALNVMSHTKEVRNSAANRMMQRLIYLKDKDSSEEDSNPQEESPQILRRSLTFNPNTDSQSQERLLMQGRNMHQLEGFDSQTAVPKSSSGLFTSVKATMDPENQEITLQSDADVQCNQTVDEDAASRSMQELKRAKVLQELWVAEEKLADLERHSGVLRGKAQFLHQDVADRCMERDWRIGTKEWANLSPYTLFKRLKKQCFLMSGVQWWDMETTKTGDDEVAHVFKYWSLLTHSVHQKTANRLEVAIVKSTIDLNQGIIDQAFRHINASLAWQTLLSGHENIMPRCSQLSLVQDVSSKVTTLLDLMEEVNKCRKYLVIPWFLLSTDGGLQLKLQFSNGDLLFDFAVLLDLREWLGQKENMACEVNLEASGRYGGRKITVEEIKKAVACISPGGSRLLRICASVDSLIQRIRMQPMTGSEADDQEAWIRDLIFN